MEQFFEFVGRNWMLVGVWTALIVALGLHRSKTTASAVGLQQAVFLINRKDALVLDVRDKKEFEAGHVVEAIHIPMSSLNSRLKELEKHKSRPIVVTDRMGQHTGTAAKILRDAGFEQVFRMGGGMAAWRAERLPLIQKK